MKFINHLENEKVIIINKHVESKSQIKVGEDAKKTEPLYTAGRDIKCYSQFGRESVNSSD